MAITGVSIVQLEDYPDAVYRVTAASDLPSPTFYWYVEGLFQGADKLPWRTFTVPAGSGPLVEVFDDVDDVPSLGWPGEVVFVWDHAAGAESYRVERYADGDWVEAGRVSGDLDRYRFTVRDLADGVSHQLRCVPVSNGNDGLPLTGTVLMVRRPDMPSVTWAYDEATSTLSGTVG